MTTTSTHQALIAIALTGLLSGCASTPPSHLYQLYAPENLPVQVVHSPHLQDARIVVGYVRIPKHLDRPHIVTQADNVELTFSEFERWGEPLGGHLGDVLALDLGALLPGSLVWSERGTDRVDGDYRIRVQVLRMTGTLGEEARFTARWSIEDDEEGQVLKTALSEHRIHLDEGDHRAYVSGLSELLLRTAREIAAALHALPPPDDGDAVQGR